MAATCSTCHVYDDITKITQACTTAQENTGKLIENTIPQALTKPQGVTLPTLQWIIQLSE